MSGSVLAVRHLLGDIMGERDLFCEPTSSLSFLLVPPTQPRPKGPGRLSASLDQGLAGDVKDIVVECRPVVLANKIQLSKNNGAIRRKLHEQISCEDCQILLHMHTSICMCSALFDLRAAFVPLGGAFRFSAMIVSLPYSLLKDYNDFPSFC